MPFVSLTPAELDAYGIDLSELACRFTLSTTDKARLSALLAHTGFDLQDKVFCKFMIGSILLWQ